MRMRLVTDHTKARAPFAPWDRRELPGLFSVEETAALLRISAGSVKSHTSRALGALRVRLGPSDAAQTNSAASGGVT